MKSRMCNHCKKWSQVSEFKYECPECGVPRGAPKGYQVMPDIKPYQSMATGEEIGSRSKHREHLKRHGLIEVGNERLEARPHSDKSFDESRKRAITQMVDQIGADQIRSAARKLGEDLKWNNRR